MTSSVAGPATVSTPCSKARRTSTLAAVMATDANTPSATPNTVRKVRKGCWKAWARISALASGKGNLIDHPISNKLPRYDAQGEHRFASLDAARETSAQNGSFVYRIPVLC